MRLIYVTYILVMLVVVGLEISRKKVVRNNEVSRYRYCVFGVVMFAILLMFISGFRERFIDTSDYRLMYEAIGTNLDNVFNNTVSRVEKGYLFFTYLLNCISTDSQFLLIVTSIIVNAIYVRKIYKYSEDVPFSLFLYFVLSFVGTMNGLRQTLAASISILFFEWILEKKTVRYVLLILLLTTIHKSVLICILVYFIVRGKFFNFGIKGALIFSMLMLVAPSGIILVLEEILGDSGYAAYLNSTEGMNVFRFLVSSVPIVLIVIFHKYNKEHDIIEDYALTTMMNICFVNLAASIMALKILFFGRISMYFTIYSLILMPTIIRRIFNYRSAFLLKISAIILYSLYFTYQVKAYGGMHSFKLIF